jgi:hypothetical protein
MDAQLETTFIDCLDALAQGEPLEQVLARHPREAAQLRPLLETTAGLTRLRMEPSEAAKLRSQQKFMAQADLLRRAAPRRTLGFLPRFAIGFAAAALVALVLGTGVIAASGSALPGDPLYGVKRTVENVRLNAAINAAVHDNLQNEFAQRRRDEIGALLTAGRPQTVEFQGPIESLQTGAWIVGGLVVQVTADTAIEGMPQLDQLAQVRGETGPAGLRAISISIAPGGNPTIMPTPDFVQPTPANTPQPTSTIAPRVTPTPKPSNVPGVTVTPDATATLRPMPTPVPAVASATPEPVEVEFEGTVNTIDPTAWTVDGAVVNLLPDTEIRGSIHVGQRVKVYALRLANGQLSATRIELAEDSGPGTPPNDGGGGNQNSSNGNGDNNGNDDNGNDNGNEDNGNDNGNDDDNGNDNDNDNGNDNGNGNDNEDRGDVNGNSDSND